MTCAAHSQPAHLLPTTVTWHWCTMPSPSSMTASNCGYVVSERKALTSSELSETHFPSRRVCDRNTYAFTCGQRHAVRRWSCSSSVTPSRAAPDLRYNFGAGHPPRSHSQRYRLAQGRQVHSSSLRVPYVSSSRGRPAACSCLVGDRSRQHGDGTRPSDELDTRHPCGTTIIAT